MKFKFTLFLLIIFIVIINISHYFPSAIDKYFSSGAYLIISGLLQSISSLISFPLFFILLFSLIIYLIKSFIYKKWEFSAILLNVFLIIIVGFYSTWGFNYSRSDIVDKLKFTKDTIPDYVLKELLIINSKSLNIISQKIKNQDIKPTIDKKLIDEIINQTRTVMTGLGYTTPKKVVVKEFLPTGFLLSLSTAGFYFPFTSECYYDPGLHPIQMPFVIAHECVHGFGIGDEGTCNFIAFLSCIQLDELIVQYSAQISYWKTLKKMKVNADIPSSKLLCPLVLDDFVLIKNKMNQYPDIFPETRDLIYNIFLKLQGIEEGETNYDRYLNLLYQYNQKKIL